MHPELGGSTTAELDQNDAGPSKLLLLDLQEGADKMKRKVNPFKLQEAWGS